MIVGVFILPPSPLWFPCALCTLSYFYVPHCVLTQTELSNYLRIDFCSEWFVAMVRPRRLTRLLRWVNGCIATTSQSSDIRSQYLSHAGECSWHHKTRETKTTRTETCPYQRGRRISDGSRKEVNSRVLHEDDDMLSLWFRLFNEIASPIAHCTMYWIIYTIQMIVFRIVLSLSIGDDLTDPVLGYLLFMGWSSFPVHFWHDTGYIVLHNCEVGLDGDFWRDQSSHPFLKVLHTWHGRAIAGAEAEPAVFGLVVRADELELWEWQ
jgi:hypothetical protein